MHNPTTFLHSACILHCGDCTRSFGIALLKAISPAVLSSTLFPRQNPRSRLLVSAAQQVQLFRLVYDMLVASQAAGDALVRLGRARRRLWLLDGTVRTVISHAGRQTGGQWRLLFSWLRQLGRLGVAV